MQFFQIFSNNFMNYFIKFGKNRLNIKKTLIIGIIKEWN